MQVTVDLVVTAQTVRERWTPDAANAFIDAAVGLSGLTPWAQRSVVNMPDRLVFYQLIAESHICGHLYRDYRRGWIDVFSCKDLDPVEIGRTVQRHLANPGDQVRVEILDRGVLPEGEPHGAHNQGADPPL